MTQQHYLYAATYRNSNDETEIAFAAPDEESYHKIAKALGYQPADCDRFIGPNGDVLVPDLRILLMRP